MPSDDENAPARASPDLPPRNDILYAPALSLWRHWRLALEGLRVSEEESAEREQSDATITKADFYNLDDIATSAIFGTDGWVDVGTQPILLGRMDVLALAAVLRPLLSPWRHESAVIYPLVGQTAAAALKFSVKRTKLLEVLLVSYMNMCGPFSRVEPFRTDVYGTPQVGIRAKVDIATNTFLPELVGFISLDVQCTDEDISCLGDDETGYRLLLGPARLANGSCSPNAEIWRVGDEALVFAVKDVSKGTELVLDYGDQYWDGNECQCPVHYRQ